MNIDKKELIEILTANTPKQWSESDVSDEMLAEFNKEYNSFLKIYPGYDPFATDDYRGKQDDDFLGVLVKTAEAGGTDLGFDDTQEEGGEELVGESLVHEGWPDQYSNAKFSHEDSENALDAAYAPLSWSAVKSVMKKFPSRTVQSALNNNHDWKSYKNAVYGYLPKIAAFCLGPELDGNLSCWTGHENGPVAIRNMVIKDLVEHKEVVSSIMEALIEKHPMSPAVKAMMRNEVLPNLHMRVYENSLELEAGEFADIAAALNAAASSLADIVHGFVSKAMAKAGEMGVKKKTTESADGGSDGNPATDDNQNIGATYKQALDGGMDTDAAIAKTAETYKLSDAKVREVLTGLNVNLDASRTTTSKLKAGAPAASNDPNAASGAAEPPKKNEGSNPFSLHVNKQYQTASGQVLTLRKVSGDGNAHLVFEDDNTGERVEMMKDKFLNMNPTEANIDSTKTKRAIINKFKRRINLSTMKHTAKFIIRDKKKGNRKVYEALDTIKTGGRPVGDIAGVVIGTPSNSEKSNEFVIGDSVKAGDVHGVIDGFKINENEEPEIIVKTPDGEEVTISVTDFAESEPEHMEVATMDEHLEYKGYGLLQNAEDQTWSVTMGDEKIEGAEGMTEEDAKAWIDAKIEEEGGEGGEGEEMEASESISRKFITESKDGSVKLKTFSQVLKESKNPTLKANLIGNKVKPTAAKK